MEFQKGFRRDCSLEIKALARDHGTTNPLARDIKASAGGVTKLVTKQMNAGRKGKEKEQG